MDFFQALLLCFPTLLGYVPLVSAQHNFVVPWNNTSFGPDGPWQAVDITVGGNDSRAVIGSENVSTITVYPGGEWQSMTLPKAACEDFTSDPLCGIGGFWEPDDEDADQVPIQLPYNFRDNTSGIVAENGRAIVLGLTIGGKTVYNATLASAQKANITYPNGRTGGVPLGFLALGAPATKQFFSLSSTEKDSGYSAWLFAGSLYDNKEIQSYSYGLHIGSAAFKYPGSLVFGGYNKGRVIGPITSYTDQQAVDLIDIGIGVEFGDSPFDFTNKSQLLDGGQTAVHPDPLSPYLSLPGKTCETLASLLPVTFDNALKYYLWNTEDERYKRIVSSPAYLSFSFPPAPGEGDNVVIKVPFALLNLTLDEPITDKPTQYFPCVPYNDGNPVLGRSFLQAAFVGRNWITKTSWLAQAPGPGVSRVGLGDQNTDIEDSATTIEAFKGANLFNQSWTGHWSIISSQKQSPPAESETPQPGSSNTSSSGLSTGAKAGIGVGVAVVAIGALGAVLLFFRKRSAASKGGDQYAPPNNHPDAYTPVQKHPSEYYAQTNHYDPNRPMSELPTAYAGADPVEAPDTSQPHMR